MGVAGLWGELQKYGHETALARLSDLLTPPHLTEDRDTTSAASPPHSLRLGIDVSSWLFHSKQAIGGFSPQLRLLFYRLCRLLTVPHVLPVFVFDGPHRPREKRGKVMQQYREESFVSDLKSLIRAFGFVVHDAIGEAEAELARMNGANLLDAVMSDDADCFLFGAKLVLKNWGQGLSGAKARVKYVTEQSASEEIATSSSASSSASEEEDQLLTAKDRQALGNNLITFFRSSDLEEDGLSRGGLILVAILSGGDYDIQGLPRCGAKISTALARAGYGDSLLEGVHKHCKPPKKNQSSDRSSRGRLEAPITGPTWPIFIASWLESVREELSDDKSGHLGRRFKKLANSADFANLLSTKASLCVLGSYVWPLTNEGECPCLSSQSIDVAEISQKCQQFFCWTAPSVLETFRNNLWEGLTTQDLLGRLVSGLDRQANAAPFLAKVNSSKRGEASGSKKISTFFASRTAGSIPDLLMTGKIAHCTSPVLAIVGERRSASTGYAKEVRIVCDVRAYVSLAKRGLNFSLTVEDLRPPASQDSTPSPRKRKPFAEPGKELRLWLAQDVVQRNESANLEYVKYSKAKTTTAKNTSLKKKKSEDASKQGQLDSFFLGSKKPTLVDLPVRPIKLSPKKRRAAVSGDSQASHSSAPSRSPSPIIASRMSLHMASGNVARKEMELAQPSNIPMSEVASTEIPLALQSWKTSTLICSNDNERESIFNSAGESSIGDYSLPSIDYRHPAKRGDLNSEAGDDRVEFLGAKVSPLKQGKDSTPQVIEVSDDSIG